MAAGQSAARAWRMGAISLKKSEIEYPFRRTLPSKSLRRVFCFPAPFKTKASPAGKPERETRIPGLARLSARAASSAGPVGGNEGDEPDTDGRANRKGFARRRAIVPSAATEFI
jgi:hypothetical protein